MSDEVSCFIAPKPEAFSFWTPVEFKSTNKKIYVPNTPADKSSWAHYAWAIGSYFDQYLFLGDSQIRVSPEKLDEHKFSFEKNKKIGIDKWDTAAKVATYVLILASSIWLGWPVFILPIFALAAKVAFKWQLNSIAALKPKPIVEIPSMNEVYAEKFFGKTKVTLNIGSLLEENTDAIVNAANTGLLAGGGICGAIYDNAGIGPFEECLAILGKQERAAIDTGEAVLTTAGTLTKVKLIVHAAGPRYSAADKDTVDYPALLASAYRSSLELITNPDEHKNFISEEVLKDLKKGRTIAFPSISTGIFSYPLKEAAPIALKTIQTFCEKNPDALDEVRFVFLKKENLVSEAYKNALEAL